MIVKYTGRISKYDMSNIYKKGVVQKLKMDFAVSKFAIGPYHPDTLVEDNDGKNGAVNGINYIDAMFASIVSHRRLTILKKANGVMDHKLEDAVRRKLPLFSLKVQVGSFFRYLLMSDTKLFQIIHNSDSSLGQVTILTLEGGRVDIRNEAFQYDRDL